MNCWNLRLATLSGSATPPDGPAISAVFLLKENCFSRSLAWPFSPEGGGLAGRSTWQSAGVSAMDPILRWMLWGAGSCAERGLVVGLKSLGAGYRGLVAGDKGLVAGYRGLVAG